MPEWRETTLGEVAEVIGGGTPSTKRPEYWEGDVLWLTPGELTKRAGQVITSTERQITREGLAGSSAKLLPTGAVLLTSRATVGVVGLAGQPMATNQGFQSLIVGSDVLPRFLMCWIQENRHEFESRASGSTFPEISGHKVKVIPITIPTIDEQRRIVDVSILLDDCAQSVLHELEAAQRFLDRSAVASCSLPGLNADLAVHDLLSRSIGGSWGSPPGVDGQDVDVYRSTEFSDWGLLSGRADAQRSVPSSHYAARDLQPGDILIEKSGGTPNRSTGRVVQVREADLFGPSIGANFLQIVRVDSKLALPRYVFWVLWAAHRRGDGFDFQTASTNIRNLRTRDYLARRIDLPDAGTQASVAQMLDGMLTTVESLKREFKQLRSFRSTLLTALLSQTVTIPEAYDAVLEAVPTAGVPEDVTA